MRIGLVGLLASAPAFAGVTAYTVQNGDWSNTATWVSGYIPQDADAAVVTNNITLTNGTAQLAAFTINAGKTMKFCTTNAVLKAEQVTVYGTLTHTNNTATAAVSGQWIPNGLVNIICSNLFVDAVGSINADMLGYAGIPTGSGTGRGPGGGGPSVGGGYGGIGGGGTLVYGTASAPDQPGSGGGSTGAGDPSGAGGGLIWILATQGTVTVNGKISANGQFLTPPGGGQGHAGGGSGGGIYIACNALAGTGTVSAAGGYGQPWGGGGGGGGRVAVIWNPVAQSNAAPATVRFRCGPGLGSGGGAGPNGAPGTIYLPSSQILPTTWSGSVMSAVMMGFPSWAPSQLAVTDAVVTLQTRTQVRVTNDISIAGITTSTAGFSLTNASTLACGGNLLINGGYLLLSPGLGTEVPSLEVNGNVSLVSTARLHVVAAVTNSSPTGAWVRVAGSMSLTNGSVVYPYCNSTNGGAVAFLVNSLSISDTNSGFNADGRGFMGTLVGVKTNGWGPGGGRFGNGGAGGGHGGAGGASSGNPGGGTYGSSNKPPVYPGSGGGNGVNGVAAGSPGGGLIWIEANKTITLNGFLRASSGPMVGTSGNGGGAGGGIYLKCRTIQGTTGKLTADGGNGGDYSGSCDGGGGGGGGRIQVWSVFNTTGGALTTSVKKGLCVPNNRGVDGIAGTVYWGTLPLQSGTLILIW